MGTSLNDLTNEFSPEDRKEIEDGYQVLKAEYLTLQELRKARQLTQEQVASELKISQHGVSKLERRADMMLSTLRGYIEALGGKMNITVEIPGHPSVSISGLGDIPGDIGQTP